MLRIERGGKLLKRGRTVRFRRRNFKDCDMTTMTKGSASAPSRKCDDFKAGVHQTPRHLRCRQRLGESDGHDDHWRQCSHELVSRKAMQLTALAQDLTQAAPECARRGHKT